MVLLFTIIAISQAMMLDGVLVLPSLLDYASDRTAVLFFFGTVTQGKA